MKERLQIGFFGGFRLSCNDKAVSLVHIPRLQQLLAYLILHRTTQLSRRTPAFLFWSQSSEKQAYTNLRNLLHQMRQIMPQVESHIHITYKTIQWNSTSSCDVDVIMFEELTAKYERDKTSQSTDQNEALLTQAIHLYKGVLLPDCYDEWMDVHRERLNWKYQSALHELVLLLESKGDYFNAIHYSHLWIQSEPYNEVAWCKLLQLHAKNKDILGVMQAYHRYSESLLAEFNLKPSAQFRKLYDQIIENTRIEADKHPVTPGLLSGDYQW